MAPHKRKFVLVVTVIVIVGVIWYLESMKVIPVASKNGNGVEVIALPPLNPSSSPQAAVDSAAAIKAIAALDVKNGDQRAVELSDPTGFVNTEPFKLSDLAGKKVILVDFWTYSCINCIRTLPHLNEWYQKYHDAGLEIVGVHTPEFEFEKDINNVKAAVSKFGVKYPVVLDSNQSTWQAYGNLYWPHEYLINIAGYVVHDQVGEGNYDETERKIQELLQQRTDALGDNMAIDHTITSPSQDNIEAMSPETYFGAARNGFLANGDYGKTGEQYFKEPAAVKANSLYLIGQWNIAPEYAETPASVGSGQVGSDRIDYLYQAKGVYFVAGSVKGPIDVEVLSDGKPIDAKSKGADVFYKNGKSYVTVNENRLYRIIDNPAVCTQDGVCTDGAQKHLLEFIISSPGLQAFTFTFG